MDRNEAIKILDGQSRLFYATDESFAKNPAFYMVDLPKCLEAVAVFLAELELGKWMAQHYIIKRCFADCNWFASFGQKLVATHHDEIPTKIKAIRTQPYFATSNASTNAAVQ